MPSQSNKKIGAQIEEVILKRIPWEILLVAFIISLLSLIFFNPLTAVFIFGGGLLSALSFIWLKQSLTSLLLSSKKKKSLKPALISYGLRLVLIIIVFFIIIFFFSRKIWAVIAGFSTILLVIAAESIVMLFKAKNGKIRT